MSALKGTDKTGLNGGTGITTVVDVSEGQPNEVVKPLLGRPDTTQVVITTVGVGVGAKPSDAVSVRVGKRTRGVRHMGANEFSARATAQLGKLFEMLRSIHR